MASGSIDIPTRAFSSFDEFMGKHPGISSDLAAGELQRLLNTAQDALSPGLQKQTVATNVFFGHRDPLSGHFGLYRLDSKDSFLPKIRDGMIAAGSYGECTVEPFKNIKQQYPGLKLHPFDDHPNNVVDFKDGVASLMITLLHSVLELAECGESETLQPQGIGGTVQAAIITAKGPKVFNPKEYNNLKAWQIYKGYLE